jgi:O-antigen ligase
MIFAVTHPRFAARQALVADSLALALVASVPLSTSATAILAVAWLISMIATLRRGDVGVVRAHAALWLPFAFVALGIVGMLWAGVGWIERWKGLDSFLKLAAIPLLILQFRRSDRALLALWVYLGACVVVLALSTLFYAMPSLYWRDMFTFPAPFKNNATQSGEFVACIFILLPLAAVAWQRGRHWQAVAAIALAAWFLHNIVFAGTARTPLVVAPVLLLALLIRMRRPAIAALSLAVACVIAAGLWTASPYLRERTIQLRTEIDVYRQGNRASSSGERLEFWKKSLESIATAPVIGHGTGSIPEQFRLQTVGETGPYATITPNPHQQTFAVAIQLGIVGVVLLWAMWVAHSLLFRGPGLAAWVGLLAVIQNVIGSLFNSHLFDFTQGWTYVIGVGIAGGAVLKQRERDRGAVS